MLVSIFQDPLAYFETNFSYQDYFRMEGVFNSFKVTKADVSALWFMGQYY